MVSPKSIWIVDCFGRSVVKRRGEKKEIPWSTFELRLSGLPIGYADHYTLKFNCSETKSLMFFVIVSKRNFGIALKCINAKNQISKSLL